MPAPKKYSMILNNAIIWVFCSLIFISPVFAQDARPWQELETEHTIIKYQSDKDLILFHKSVKYGPGKWNRNPLFSDISVSEIRTMLSEKVDAIFMRAQEILDMEKKLKKIKIHIYPDSFSLKQVYTEIYKGPCKIRAWYRYRTNTVYINVQDVHAGMLAHELAHGIIDHFLLVKPPSQTAEILARYVDAHLE